MSLDDFNAWQETVYLTRSSSNAKDLLVAVEEIRLRKNLVQHELVDTL
jgi:antitoxin YefM